MGYAAEVDEFVTMVNAIKSEEGLVFAFVREASEDYVGGLLVETKITRSGFGSSERLEAQIDCAATERGLVNITGAWSLLSKSSSIDCAHFGKRAKT